MAHGSKFIPMSYEREEGNTEQSGRATFQTSLSPNPRDKRVNERCQNSNLCSSNPTYALSCASRIKSQDCRKQTVKKLGGNLLVY